MVDKQHGRRCAFVLLLCTSDIDLNDLKLIHLSTHDASVMATTAPHTPPVGGGFIAPSAHLSFRLQR